MARHPRWTGSISDVGGPTANMYGARCASPGPCARESCVSPARCPHFRLDDSGHLAALRAAARVRGVRHVFVGTGIRHDLVTDGRGGYLEELCRSHVGGHLKVAPEHICPEVLAVMRKEGGERYGEFRERFAAACRRTGKQLYLVPYFMSGHPGTTVEHMVELAEFLHRGGVFVEQVQDFTPLPMTLAAAIDHTGADPLTGRSVRAVRGPEKAIQRALLQPSDRRNRDRVEPVLNRMRKRHLLRPPRHARAGRDGREKQR